MKKRAAFTRKIRWLTQSLLLSGVLNLLLIAIFFYLVLRGTPHSFSFEYIPPSQEIQTLLLTNEKLLNLFSSLSFSELIGKLEEKNLVEEGYANRDLALAVLVNNHHFDLKKALPKKNLQARRQKDKMVLFAGLSDEDYEKIVLFAQTEKWPLTAEGLFLRLKSLQDPALFFTFLQTPEFLALQTLFARAEVPISKKELLDLAREGNWKLLSEHLSRQKTQQNFTADVRREVLLSYMEQGSKTAASLLLKIERDWALKRFSDLQIGRLLLLCDKDVEFAKALIASPRCEGVRRLAAKRLLEWREISGEVAQRPGPRPGIGELRPTFRDRPPASPPPNLHIIQAGESLWTIARKYNVHVDSLMKFNGLQSTTLKAGKTLKIPQA